MPTLIKAGAALSSKCGCYEMQVDSGDSLGPSEETQETGVKENSKCFEISRDSCHVFTTHSQEGNNTVSLTDSRSRRRKTKQNKFINLVLF